MGGYERSDSPLQKWQDKINSGFDKLVAFASEVDKRRKSTEGTSPRHDVLGSPRRTDRRPTLPLTDSPHGLEAFRSRDMDEEGCRRGEGISGPPPYSPHSPPRLSPSPIPHGRPPTPQSPRPPVRTPPITSPPPTPSPDHCLESPPPSLFPARGADTPPYPPPELETTRIVSPATSPSDHGVYHHHFKKKFYHKEPQHHQSSGLDSSQPPPPQPPSQSQQQQQQQHHHHSSSSHHHGSHHGKFRPKAVAPHHHPNPIVTIVTTTTAVIITADTRLHIQQHVIITATIHWSHQHLWDNGHSSSHSNNISIIKQTSSRCQREKNEEREKKK
ncbi:hypothetical protein Pcinc_015008 [Petrolisthes cinctipes]|uniref:Uncharacterized protein n=1 Tax=Petrolisthes cinctipes TaxID=88211 RepID=A0AAE1FTZ6_PETCI|nr:hypothetical protein Pcinc_015008 [Petrolisthes cinctipes]